MTQTMLVNILCFVGSAGVAVLQHFGYVDAVAAGVLYGIAGGFIGGAGTLKVTPGAKVVLSKAAPTNSVQQSPINSSRG